jgi:hypothetical protein
VENPILLVGAGLVIVATVLALVQEVTVDKKEARRSPQGAGDQHPDGWPPLYARPGGWP